MNAMEVAMRMLETGNNNQIIESDLILASGKIQILESEQNQTYTDLTQIRYNPNSETSKNIVHLALNKVLNNFVKF